MPVLYLDCISRCNAAATASVLPGAERAWRPNQGTLSLPPRVTDAAAQALSVIDIYPDAEFSAYGLGAEQIQQMRERFAEWRLELLRQPGPTVA